MSFPTHKNVSENTYRVLIHTPFLIANDVIGIYLCRPIFVPMPVLWTFSLPFWLYYFASWCFYFNFCKFKQKIFLLQNCFLHLNAHLIELNWNRDTQKIDNCICQKWIFTRMVQRCTGDQHFANQKIIHSITSWSTFFAQFYWHLHARTQNAIKN